MCFKSIPSAKAYSEEPSLNLYHVNLQNLTRQLICSFSVPYIPKGRVCPSGLLSHSLCFNDNQNNDARTAFFNKVKAESLCQRRIVLQRCLAENGLGLIAEMDFLMGVSLRRTQPLCLCTVYKNIKCLNFLKSFAMIRWNEVIFVILVISIGFLLFWMFLTQCMTTFVT